MFISKYDDFADESRQFASIQGMAIGNGFMNAELSMNKLILWAAYHGRTSADEWDQIKEACRTEGAKDVDSYNFVVIFLLLKSRKQEIFEIHDFEEWHRVHTEQLYLRQTSAAADECEAQRRTGLDV